MPETWPLADFPQGALVGHSRRVAAPKPSGGIPLPACYATVAQGGGCEPIFISMNVNPLNASKPNWPDAIWTHIEYVFSFFDNGFEFCVDPGQNVEFRRNLPST